MKDIEIFKAGKHKDANGQVVEITKDDLVNISKEYDIKQHEAPVVIGHPQADAPAYAWVENLYTKDDSLYANFSQIDPEFKNLVNEGRYKKISASFYKPKTMTNPSPNKHWYLRHVGFLGATPPAIKGLKQVSFSDGSAAFCDFCTQTEPNSINQMGTVPLQDQNLINQINTNGDLLIMETKEMQEMQEMQAKLAQAEQKIKQLELEKDQAKNQALVKENIAFSEELIKEGKIAPAFKTSVINVLNALTGLDTADFSENKADLNAVKTGFKDYLNALPESNLDKELVAKDFDNSNFSEADFSDSKSLDQKISAIATKHKISYDDAFNKVIGGVI